MTGSVGATQQKPYNLRASNVICPKVNVISPKVNVVSPKVNVISPKVNVKYFSEFFEEFKVFELSFWGVTVTGVSKRSKT